MKVEDNGERSKMKKEWRKRRKADRKTQIK